MTSRSITMSKEIEEMEMMDRQFNNRGGGDSMFTRRRQMQMEMESHKMNQMDRFSSPWDNEEDDFGFDQGRGYNIGGGGGGMRNRGGMMGSSGRGMSRSGMGGFGGARSSFGGGMSRNIDPTVGLDNDYMNYNDGGGMGMGGMGGNFSRGGMSNRNSSGGMGMNRNMDRGMGMGSNRSGGNFGRGGSQGKSRDINSGFDSLYTPEFGSKSSAFDKARSKLNQFSSSPSTPGSYKGPSMGPPKKTWSN